MERIFLTGTYIEIDMHTSSLLLYCNLGLWFDESKVQKLVKIVD